MKRMVEDKAKNIQREKYIKILYLYLFILHTSDKTKYNVITSKLLIFFFKLCVIRSKLFSKKLNNERDNNLSRNIRYFYTSYRTTLYTFF